MGRSGLAVAVAVLVGFAGSCASVYYSVWEHLGYEKRDLLRSEVEAAREEQQATREQFVSALERIRAAYGVEGGELEARYDAVRREYERSRARADALRERIARVERLAADLFSEWESELAEIRDPALRARSRRQLSSTRRRYAKLHAAFAKTEAGLDPVLGRLHDQVLFLKHSLNARAVGTLEGELGDVERDIDRLLEDLERSIRRTDEFIGTLPR